MKEKKRDMDRSSSLGKEKVYCCNGACYFCENINKLPL